jgi:hypothetical protein
MFFPIDSFRNDFKGRPFRTRAKHGIMYSLDTLKYPYDNHIYIKTRNKDLKLYSISPYDRNSSIPTHFKFRLTFYLYKQLLNPYSILNNNFFLKQNIVYIYYNK